MSIDIVPEQFILCIEALEDEYHKISANKLSFLSYFMVTFNSPIV